MEYCSFASGLAFCALINKFNPELIDFKSLDPQDSLHNLTLAFNVAEEHLYLSLPPSILLYSSPDPFIHTLYSVSSIIQSIYQIGPSSLSLSIHFHSSIRGIPKLLDAADMVNDNVSLRPDEKSIMTYLAEFPVVWFKNKSFRLHRSQVVIT